VTTEKLAKKAGLVILAIPLKNFRHIDSSLFSGNIVVDAMNYWPEVDGELSDIIPGEMSQSEEVQRYFASARVIKALNHMGYHHLLDEARPGGASGRKAIAIAGDDHEGVVVVAQVVDAIGFDALVIGDLASGKALEIGMPAFGANTTESELKKLARP
jgi:predicted dinucleotide-binding enzyme